MPDTKTEKQLQVHLERSPSGNLFVIQYDEKNMPHVTYLFDKDAREMAEFILSGDKADRSFG
jgi:hypothetical protein